ncbi:hypothetical protein FLM9_309 [Candidatus Synechococcus spongiarum]|uniref:Uncharacterized protein n=1 Tax=Candidatus Synechococcus spongiarum TaxID=431041 RepID=A0A170T5F4_9SYNE|nr:hypothetical protein FLM9_309 [Candidatus Synechococcus spongiarum]
MRHHGAVDRAGRQGAVIRIRTHKERKRSTDTAPEAGVEPEEALMIDTTCVKAHRTASSLKKGSPNLV